MTTLRRTRASLVLELMLLVAVWGVEIFDLVLAYSNPDTDPLVLLLQSIFACAVVSVMIPLVIADLAELDEQGEQNTREMQGSWPGR